MNQKYLPIIFSLIVVVFLATAVVLYNRSGEDADNPATDSLVETQRGSSSTPLSERSDVYLDGTYEATGTYMSPGGLDEISVEITISDNKVSDVKIAAIQAGAESRRYISEFAGNIATVVVGQEISDLEVGKVASASLTGQGFNEALDKIRDQAVVSLSVQ